MASGRSRRMSRIKRSKTSAGVALPSAVPDRLATVQRNKARQEYRFRLFVNGMSWASARAIERVRAICDKHLRNRYRLEVVDIFQLPALAREEQIIATPTLVKAQPLPLRRFIGDFSNLEKVLFSLDPHGSSNDSTV